MMLKFYFFTAQNDKFFVSRVGAALSYLGPFFIIY